MKRLGKLQLILADNDEDYVEGLGNYIRKHHGSGFDVCSFTDEGCLGAYLSDAGNRADILLAGREFIKAGLCGKRAENVFMLDDGKGEAPFKEVHTINRYQHAEKLTTEILRGYSAGGAASSLPAGKNPTVAACFISPEGGSGKSVLSVGCSLVCARRGLKTLYLNMEDLPSTGLFFEGESEQNFSNVIYYLKCKDKNLDIKLTGAKCTDLRNGVCFYLPPECSMEAACLSPQEVEGLIGALGRAGAYDAVFIDMPGGLDDRTAAAMAACSKVVCVYGCDSASAHKLELLQRELALLERRLIPDLPEKLIYVSNRNKNPGDGYSGPGPVKEAAVAFEFCREPHRDAGFNSGVSALLGKINRGWSI